MSYAYYNPNPIGRNVSDCSVRAICAALDMAWESAYTALCLEGYVMCDLPNSNACWGSLLLRNGFKKQLISDSCLNGYTVEHFAKDNAEGVFVVAVPNHVVCIKDGEILDSWDSGNEIVLYAFKKEGGA